MSRNADARTARRTDVVLGALSGTAAGVLSGAIPVKLEMLPTLALTFGSHSAVVGGAIHLLVSASLGIVFATYLRSATHLRDLVTGSVLFGSIWWLVIPILLVPAWLSQNTDVAVVQFALMSIAGQAIYGPLNGLFLFLLIRRGPRPTR